MKKKSFLNGILTGISLFIITAGFIYYNFIKPSDIKIKQIEIQDLKGNNIKLNQFEGKPLIVNFWATWCKPCLVEFPHFEKVIEKEGDNINFIMISEETTEKINAFKAKHPFRFNFLRSSKKFSEYGITALTAIPTTYFYDANGDLKTIHSSSLDAKTLLELIKQIK